MSVEVVNESSPLLAKSKSVTKFSILMELIGARQLPIQEELETYCVVQYGARTIHRTKPFVPDISKSARISRALHINGLFGSGSSEQILRKQLQNPIWTIQQNSVFSFEITRKDFDNHKPIIITVWARPQGGKAKSTKGLFKDNSSYPTFLGKLRLAPLFILQNCTEERLELQLIDDLGNIIFSRNNDNESSLLAFTCRMASSADLAFCHHWNYEDNKTLLQQKSFRVHDNPTATKLAVRDQQSDQQLWKDADILNQQSSRASGILITELDETLDQGHNLSSAIVSGTLSSALQAPAGQVKVKPYPNPNHPIEYMSPLQLKSQTQLPSSNWVQAGQPTLGLGRLFLEILSAKNLPNVDFGEQVGNVTDAFCAVIYGDSMVQTDVIDDELNPHWLPWTQRAFCFHIQHPANVLYLSVFGFKGFPLHHRPIGRVEINPIHLQNNTLYNLEYDLFGSSHTSFRESQGTIRIRVRREEDDERKYLLAALRPLPSAVHINVTKKKSMLVARFTACGEYDNEEKFSLKVLQGYIDEIVEGYLRRIVYAMQDSVRSIVFWRNDQVYIWGHGTPIISFLLFVVGMLVVEHPHFIPAMVCFGLALIMLIKMQRRLNCPSPWGRCFSFGHYFRVLLTGKSKPSFKTIDINQGYNEYKAEQDAFKKRIEHDREQMEQRESIEKEVEQLEDQGKVETKSNVIPLELLVILGRVQGIVGDVCRLFRLIDSIISWEESDCAFLITLGLLTIGFVFLFIPWVWLFQFLGQLVVILLLGPQNKLFDIFWLKSEESDERGVRKIFAHRFFVARCKQEQARKLKAFRHELFGKFSTLVPSIMWTPHQDFPLPTSTAQVGNSKDPGSEKVKLTPSIIGQQLHGTIIPRQELAWLRNQEESLKHKQEVDTFLAKIEAGGSREEKDDYANAAAVSRISLQKVREPSILLDEGFEVTELFDEEAGFVESVQNTQGLEVELL